MIKTDEDRNVIRVLGGRSEFLESDGNASEVLGGAQSSWRAMVMHWRSQGVLRVQGFG